MQKKSKLPLVSVIVPFYNEEKHIEQCFKTLRKQTYPKIQIIAVDDGSIDSSKKIAKSYVDILLKQKHQGPGVARNRGALTAKGKILVFVDADMYFDKNYITMLTKPILRKHVKATFTNEEYVVNADNIWVMCGNIDNDIPHGKRYRKANSSLTVRAIKKDVFLGLAGMKTSLGYKDDYIFLNTKYKAIPANGSICYHYNPETLYEIYLQAIWVGKNPNISQDSKNILRYSFVNSLKLAMQKIIKGAPFAFLMYKFIFDLGILTGIISARIFKTYSK